MGRTLDEPVIRAALLDLAQARGRVRSFCPSEAARALSPDWRALMPEVRRVAALLQAEGLIAATQRGQSVQVAQARGPIRLRLASGAAHLRPGPTDPIPTGQPPRAS
ncbi:MAG: DUF3253 domain-containing protein [Roseinatronobacter sp.]